MESAQCVFQNKMPLVNCAIVGCGTSCRTKTIGIFKFPAAKNDTKNGKKKGYPELQKQGLLA